jgi:two-component system, NarL family, nitrate/nitrite response regulator NarL
MRLVVCDENRMLCEALVVALQARGHQAVAIATTAEEGIAAVARHRPDACLLDLRFQAGGDGVGAAREIWNRYPETAVVVMSDLGEQAAALATMHMSATGFPGRSTELDRITAALDGIAAGRPAAPARPAGGAEPAAARTTGPLAVLTPRETEVLRRIAAGHSTPKMAREMNVTTETLRGYVKRVLIKLGAHSRLEAAALASRYGVADRAEPDRDHPLLAVLTPREREILFHLTRGAGLREIAQQLHMSSKTINTHLHNLRGKLGVHSTLEAVALARHRLAATARECPD